MEKFSIPLSGLSFMTICSNQRVANTLFSESTNCPKDDSVMIIISTHVKWSTIQQPFHCSLADHRHDRHWGLRASIHMLHTNCFETKRLENFVIPVRTCTSHLQPGFPMQNVDITQCWHWIREIDKVVRKVQKEISTSYRISLSIPIFMLVIMEILSNWSGLGDGWSWLRYVRAMIVRMCKRIIYTFPSSALFSISGLPQFGFTFCTKYHLDHQNVDGSFHRAPSRRGIWRCCWHWWFLYCCYDWDFNASGESTLMQSYHCMLTI